MARAFIKGITVFLWIGAVGIASAENTNANESIFAKIRSLRQESKFDEAKQLASQYLEKYPKDTDMWLYFGLIEVDKKNFEYAGKIFNSLIKKNPNNLDARLALIRLKSNEKKYEEASNLINQGLLITPQEKQLLQLKKNLADSKKQPPLTVQPPKAKPLVVQKTKIDILPELRALRDKGKLQEAIDKSLKFLKTNPKDVDVALILGLMYEQKKEYPKAENQLKFVLDHTPSYVDARVGLVNIQLIDKKFNSAQELVVQGLKINPKEERLIKLKHQISSLMSGKKRVEKVLSFDETVLKKVKLLLQQKKYNDAKLLLSQMVLQYPHNVVFHIALADYYLQAHQDMKALFVIRQALKLNPRNYNLLLKEGEIHRVLHQYSLAARSYQYASTVSPPGTNIENRFNEVNEYSPRYQNGLNEIGIWTDNAYVSDLHSIWDYSGIYYTRDTNYGVFSLKVNGASRLNTVAPQYEVDLAPRFTRNIYAEFRAGFSDQPTLFPNYFFSAEPYIALPQFSEISAGAMYAKIKNTFLRTWTGSLNLYPGKYWLAFRPYYFVPQAVGPITGLPSRTSLLYTAKIRRYLGADDHYFGVGMGFGQSPDLSDLLTVDFIVIKNNFVNMDYSFPILGYRLIMNLSAGYQHWRYPSGLLRSLYDGQVGLKYRF